MLDDGSRKYVWGLGLAYSVDITGTAHVYYGDGLGSVRAIADATGQVVQTYSSDEFGVPTGTQGPSTQPFQYTGEQRDSESGFYYLRARMYDPAVGRFLSRDRFGGHVSVAASLNRYVYAHNRPTVYTDPHGMCVPPTTVACVAVGAVATGGGGITLGGIATAVGVGTAFGAVISYRDQIVEAVQSLPRRVRYPDGHEEPIERNPYDTQKYQTSTGTPSFFPPPPEGPQWGGDWKQKLNFILWLLFHRAGVVVPPLLFPPDSSTGGGWEAPMTLPPPAGKK